nr:diguanylate cyclase [Pontibacillus marinus]
MYPRDGITQDELIRHANMAMYEAKNQGKNQYHFHN